MMHGVIARPPLTGARAAIPHPASSPRVKHTRGMSPVVGNSPGAGSGPRSPPSSLCSCSLAQNGELKNL